MTARIAYSAKDYTPTGRRASEVRVAARHIQGRSPSYRNMIEDAAGAWMRALGRAALGRETNDFGYRLEYENTSSSNADEVVWDVYGPEGLKGERGTIVVELEVIASGYLKIEASWGGKVIGKIHTAMLMITGGRPDEVFDDIAQQFHELHHRKVERKRKSP